MAGVKKVSEVESLVSITQNAVKKSVKNAVKHVSENKKAYAAGLGAGAIAEGIRRTLNKDKVEGHYQVTGYETGTDGVPLDSPIGFVPKTEWTENPTLFQKLQQKIRDALNVDLKNPPKGIDPSEPYMKDGAGHYIFDEYGVIPNPWYNPDFVNESVVDNFGFNKVSMKDFLANAASHSDSADAAFKGIDVVHDSFGGIVSSAGDTFISTAKDDIIDTVTDDDSVIDHMADAIKHVLDNIL